MTGMIPVALNGRWDLLLPEHRAAQWARPWETERLSAMAYLIGPTSTVYYVGAEEGDCAALCALWGASVHLFEPGARVWPGIRAIWEANHLPAPAGCWAGFAGHETTSPGPAPDGWPTCSDGPVIDDHGFRNLEERPDVPAICLDDYAARTGTIPTDISIDVEGSEGRVIDGAEWLMTEHRPRIWLSGHPEFILQHWGAWTAKPENQGRPEYLRDLRNRIIDHGYTETLLSYQHEAHLLYEARP